MLLQISARSNTIQKKEPETIFCPGFDLQLMFFQSNPY